MTSLVRRFAIVTAALCLLGATATTASASAGDDGPGIVGGSATTIDQYPYTVAIALSDPGFGDGFDRQFCGGTLVAPTIVVTAAHCFYDDDGFGTGFPEDPSDYSAITGRTTLSTGAGTEIDFDELYYFVDAGGGAAATEAASAAGEGPVLYNDSTSQWDVVFVELVVPAPAPASPILIAGADEGATWASNQAAVVSGWGLTTEGGSKSDTLMAAQLPIYDDQACVDQNAAFGFQIFTDVMVCAGFEAGGVDTCQGDSGGPLAVPILGGGYRLAGDTSFGFGCAQPQAPGVYGRVAGDPIRTALEQGILAVAGVDVTGSGAKPLVDTHAPETTLLKKPKKKTKKRKAKFTFTADDAGLPIAGFECKLDRSGFKACGSSYKKRVSRKRHKFQVRAVDQAGNEGPPVRYRWKVRKK